MTWKDLMSAVSYIKTKGLNFLFLDPDEEDFNFFFSYMGMMSNPVDEPTQFD